MPKRFPPLPSLRDILKMYQITAKKNLSQNFILDPSVLRRFVKSAGDLSNKYVVEVGPGPGGITRALLAERPKKVLVIEKDPRFIPSLQLLQDASGGKDKLQIDIGDCLHYNIEKMIPESVRQPWDSHESPNLILVGNLPFNVATPFLIRLLKSMSDRSNLFSFGRVQCILTFQHEVAYRMAALKDDPERCRLSAICQNYAKVDYLYTLPGGSFVPPPQVSVGVVKLTPLRTPYLRSSKDTPLPFSVVNKVTSTIFHGKQKFIRNCVMNLFPKKKDYVKSQELTNYILDMSRIKPERTAISLSMDEIEKICVAYLKIIEDFDLPQNFVHPNVRASIDLTDKVLSDDYEDWEVGLKAEVNNNSPKFEINFN